MVVKSVIASSTRFSLPSPNSKKNIRPTHATPQPISIPNRNAKNCKPVPVDKGKGRYTPNEGEVDDDGRGVSLTSNGVAYRIPEAPFEFQFSYSETPNVKPVALREPPYVPFGPTTMPRPWTGSAPLTKSKRNLPPFNPRPPRNANVNGIGMMGSKDARTRDQILGEPLSRQEVRHLVEACVHSNRQVNLGRNGLTHNMLELIHEHWRRHCVCKIKCKGIPTVDMDNVCYRLEEKTSGKIIHRVGGVVYLFRGRNYDHKTRPRLPLMLWKPAAPIYPKLIERAPAGLTKEEADALREKGEYLLSICKLAKNGVYVNLVKDVKEAFEENELVRINCQGMNPSDYKKIGAKLKDLVPCVLLSFDKEHILMWRGKD
eukprot:Gb_26560 [translate_table: standard]